MTKKIFKFILAPILVLTFLIFILEVGFSARAWLETLFHAKKDTKKTQVLLVGDSILGFLRDRNSIASQVMTELQKIAPDQFQFEEVSSPALRSGVAIEKIKERFKTTSADIAILMIGKSDYLNQASRTLTTLSRFRSFRLLEAAYWDLRRRWRIIRNPRLKNLASEAQTAWDLKADNRFAEAVPIFERVLTNGYDHSRVIRGLHEGYIKTHQYARAIEFFENYKKKSAHGALIESYIPVFKSLSGGLKPDTTPAPLELTNKPQNRDDLRTLLWLAKQNNDAQKFAELYRQADAEHSETLHSTSRNNLLDLIELLKGNRTRVLLLQYPMDDVLALTRILPEELGNLQIIDTRAILEKAAATDLMNSWDEDLEHVNENGARLISTELASIILNTKKGL
ncbi:MAG: hypothetical protein HUU57_09225 [Bdellovibrio sp.]|nr:hypothetical protein [Bdellovibrio sp.]